MLCIPNLQLKVAEASVDRLSLYLELDPSSQSDGFGVCKPNECPLAIFDYRRRLEYGLINDPSTDIIDI